MADHNVHVIDRRFNALGIDREPGEVVDTSLWRNPEPLVISHRMHAAPYGLDDTAVDCDCGRRWENIDRALAHNCPERVGTTEETESSPRTSTTGKKSAA